MGLHPGMDFIIQMVVLSCLMHTLVGGSEHFLFSHILGINIPTDYIIFFRGVETTNQTQIGKKNISSFSPLLRNAFLKLAGTVKLYKHTRQKHAMPNHKM